MRLLHRHKSMRWKSTHSTAALCADARVGSATRAHTLTHLDVGCGVLQELGRDLPFCSNNAYSSTFIILIFINFSCLLRWCSWLSRTLHMKRSQVLSLDPKTRKVASSNLAWSTLLHVLPIFFFSFSPKEYLPFFSSLSPPKEYLPFFSFFTPCLIEIGSHLLFVS
jgi:hypothetical protein